MRNLIFFFLAVSFYSVAGAAEKPCPFQAPYPSWIRVVGECAWEPPVERPRGDDWHWDEVTKTWMSKAALDTLVAQRIAAANQERIDFAALKVKIEAETATATEIRRAFKFLLRKLGE